MAVKNRLPYPPKNSDGTDGKMPEALKSVDIRDTLNAHGGKVTNKTSSFFKPDANINKWSKHKPIVTGHAAGIFDKTMFVPYYSEIWDKQDGTTPAPFVNVDNEHPDNLRNVFNATSNESDWFEYVLPSGGASEPLRMGDFRGYRADAKSAFTSFDTNKTTTIINDPAVELTIFVRIKLVNDEDPVLGGMISLTDLGIFNTDYNDIYCGVIEKFGGDYKLHLGSADLQNPSTAWGYDSVTLNWTNNTESGLHEFAAVLWKTNGSCWKLPFKHIQVYVGKFYPSTTVTSKSGEVTATYHYDGSNIVYDSISVTLRATYTRGAYDTAEDEYTTTFGLGDTNYEDAGLHMPDVTFTIPNNPPGNALLPTKEVISRNTFTSSDSVFQNIVSYYENRTLVGYIDHQVIELTY